MNIQQIDYVIAVGQLKSFGQAANKCHITQSTLSTMVGKFEDEIGITIFDRKTKPITITKEGEQIIRQLKVIAKEIKNLKEVEHALKGEISGELKIGIIPTVGPYLLPLFLNEFIEKFPQVHFEVSEITTEKIVENLEKRELDIGIVSIPLKNPNLIEIPLYNEPFLLFDAADSPPNDALKINEIDFNRLWLLEEGHCMRSQVENICGLREKQRTFYRNLDYKSGTIDTLLKFVNRNDGITLIPLLASLDYNENLKIHLNKFEQPVPARAIGLVVHKHFVKKGILNLLEQEIKAKVFPYLGAPDGEQRIIPPA